MPVMSEENLNKELLHESDTKILESIRNDIQQIKKEIGKVEKSLDGILIPNALKLKEKLQKLYAVYYKRMAEEKVYTDLVNSGDLLNANEKKVYLTRKRGELLEEINEIKTKSNIKNEEIIIKELMLKTYADIINQCDKKIKEQEGKTR